MHIYILIGLINPYRRDQNLPVSKSLKMFFSGYYQRLISGGLGTVSLIPKLGGRCAYVFNK